MIPRHIIGIAGGSGAGKSYLASRLRRRIGIEKTLLLPQDYYYIGRTEEDIINRTEVNFDHPDAIDFKWFGNNLSDLCAGKSTRRPVYSMKLHQRLRRTIRVNPAEIIIVEGTLIFASELIRNLCTFKLYLDVPENRRIDRRIKRDLGERNRRIYDVMEQLRRFVLPMHRKYVEKQIGWADLVLHDDVSPDAILGHIPRAGQKEGERSARRN